MQQNGVFDLLRLLEITLEESVPLIPGKFAIVKPKEIELLIDRIYGALPMEVQEAKALLLRRDELQAEAQYKAEKIVMDAQAEAERKLSEADFIKAVEREAAKIRIQVQQECEEVKRCAIGEAEQIRYMAREEALKIRQGAEVYAEQILNNLDRELNQLQHIVKNGQAYMERLRTENPAASQDEAVNDKAADFVIK
jgi:cell division septum initiation protein DivIVA